MATYTSVSELLASYKSRFIPENAGGVDTVIQINLEGTPDEAFYVEIHNQECVVEAGAHEAPVLTVSATVEDWLKLNNHEVNPMLLMMQGKLKVEGPLHMAARFQTMFRD
ncbi:MAG: SCP2 sterol-binding domain-containing protein [Bacteroidota bacterium]